MPYNEPYHTSQLEQEKEKEMLRHVASVPPKGGRNRDVPEKGGALKPQGGSGEWRTKEGAGRRDSKPDINRIQGILKRERGKETTAGFRPQRWGVKPQGSFTPPLEAKGDRQLGKPPLRMGPQGAGLKRPVTSGNSRGPQPPPHRVASVPDSSKEQKAAIKLVAQMSNQSTTELPPSQTVMDEALMERKTVAIIKELEQTRDFGEAVDCVQEMNCPDLMHLFVIQAINHALERTSNMRRTVGKLFQVLIDEEVLNTDRFQAGCVLSTLYPLSVVTMPNGRVQKLALPAIIPILMHMLEPFQLARVLVGRRICATLKRLLILSLWKEA